MGWYSKGHCIIFIPVSVGQDTRPVRDNCRTMEYSKRLATLAGLLLALAGTGQTKDTLCLIQINDIYEIAPLQGGRTGGIARIATMIDEHRKRYPTTVLVAGDFLSPSLMGTAVVDKERLSGKQMVDLFNKVGVDIVTFGNHEFDIGEAQLQRRIDESAFQ